MKLLFHNNLFLFFQVFAVNILLYFFHCYNLRILFIKYYNCINILFKDDKDDLNEDKKHKDKNKDDIRDIIKKNIKIYYERDVFFNIFIICL